MDFSSWFNGFAVGLGCGVLISLVILLNKIAKYRKSHIFVKHIENHLDSNEDVICKICDKNIHTIFEEEK